MREPPGMKVLEHDHSSPKSVPPVSEYHFHCSSNQLLACVLPRRELFANRLAQRTSVIASTCEIHGHRNAK